MISGLFIHDWQFIYLMGALAACGLLALYAIKQHRFLYLLYAVIYGYVALSIVIVDRLHPDAIMLMLYIAGSAAGVILLILSLSRKLKGDA